MKPDVFFRKLTFEKHEKNEDIFLTKRNICYNNIYALFGTL